MNIGTKIHLRKEIERGKITLIEKWTLDFKTQKWTNKKISAKQLLDELKYIYLPMIRYHKTPKLYYLLDCGNIKFKLFRREKPYNWNLLKRRIKNEVSRSW